MTIAGLSCTVTARAEQIPRICTMTGLFAENGLVRNFMFLAEKIGSFSYSWFSFTFCWLDTSELAASFAAAGADCAAA